MKIKLILLTALLIFSFGNFAYGQQVTKDNFDNGVNFLSCKAVELALIKSPTKDVLKEFQKNCDCKNNLTDEETRACVNPNETDALKILEEVTQIKTEIQTPDSFEKAIKFLSLDVLSRQDKFPKLYSLANDSSDKNVISFKSDLRDRFNTQFSPKSTSRDSGITDSNSNTSSNSVTSVMPQDTEWFNLAFLFSLITFLLLAAVSLVGYLLYKTLDGEIRRLDRIKLEAIKGLKSPSTTAVATLSKSNSPELEKVKLDIRNLEAEINKLREYNSSLEQNKWRNQESQIVRARRENSYDFSSNRKEDYHERVSSPAAREVFYLTAPSEDKSFDKKSASTSFKEGASIYRFTKISDRQAEFQIEEQESSLTQALGYPQIIIERVCEAENSREDGVKRIVTVQPGIAELNGDKWEMKSPAKIKYEH